MLQSSVAIWLLAAGILGQAPSMLENGGFETVATARVEANQRVHGWRVNAPLLVPTAWTLNPAYPGELTVSRAVPDRPAHGGQRFVHIAADDRPAHLYQMCNGLAPGQWYRVSAWVRGGGVALSFYEYFQSARTGGQTVAQSTGGGDGWRLLTGFYRTPMDGYLRSALALSVSPGQSVDIDDVSIEPIAPSHSPDAADVVLETELLRCTISGQGILREFRDKRSGRDYAAPAVPVPVLQLVRRGVSTPLQSLIQEGDRLRAQFLDPDLRATLRVIRAPRHLVLEVVDVQPADVEQLIVEFPLQRLKIVAGAMNATYDDQFGACLWGTTANTHQQLVAHGRDVLGLAAHSTRGHRIVAARFALTAAPRDQFQAAMMETEQATGLPCPRLEGRWARDSQPVRRSYLFVVDAQESNIERLIEYAKIGHFGTILFLKDNWLATHGHYQVNRRNFPDGVASLKRAVDKIHAAGLAAGVHAFGPSISPNDPYVTPRPDDRLACVACPPLAEAVDAKSPTLTLAGLPQLPPRGPRNEAFPGYHLRIGDEIIRYQHVEAGPPPRFVRCQRGALGTKAAAHPAGAEVKGLLTLWNFFLVDPDSTLADELTGNFAAVFNACDFDMVYFDASDGIDDAYLDRGYYLNKLHLGYYRKLKKDVLYQTSNGMGANLVWHIVPRGASADGHGDLKRYLDERLPGMLGMIDNLTRPDVGWYYMYDEVRPDQIEYVCAKTIGLDGSISIETSQAAMERHPRARQMVEMVGRYEQCRLADFFPENVKALLREPHHDFKLFRDGPGWKLVRAVYEEPRFVESLDGRQNVWTLKNDRSAACPLCVEIACGFRNVRTADYDQPGALTIESFADTMPYRRSAANRNEQFFAGPDAMPTAAGASRAGVEVAFTPAAEAAPTSGRSAVLSAHNTGLRGGWCATGRRLPKPLDLSRFRAIAFWIEGDGEGETLRVQLRDTAGRAATWPVLVSFKGWRLCVFPTAAAKGIDWSKTDSLLLRLQGLAGATAVRVGLSGLRALPELRDAPPLVQPSLAVNGRAAAFPVRVLSGQALTSEGPDGARFWPGGMRPGQAVDVSPAALMLAPGDNRILFSADTTAGYPGDVNVLVYRLVPLE
jgi:hypothetical protein